MSTETISFHCTTCPNDCKLTVEVETAPDGTKSAVNVSGNRCPRGVSFAQTEVTRPERVLATTVCIAGGDEVLLPVRTNKALPFDLHFKAMELLRDVEVSAPITMGDVIVANVLNSGVDVIASMDVASV